MAESRDRTERWTDGQTSQRALTAGLVRGGIPVMAIVTDVVWRHLAVVSIVHELSALAALSMSPSSVALITLPTNSSKTTRILGVFVAGVALPHSLLFLNWPSCTHSVFGIFTLWSLFGLEAHQRVFLAHALFLHRLPPKNFSLSRCVNSLSRQQYPTTHCSAKEVALYIETS